MRRAASVLWALGSSAAIAAGAQERAPASGDAPALAVASVTATTKDQLL